MGYRIPVEGVALQIFTGICCDYRTARGMAYASGYIDRNPGGK
jgi:hypothetical protein